MAMIVCLVTPMRSANCAWVISPWANRSSRIEFVILVGSVVEEAAQAGISAGPLGGPAEIPEDLRAAALQRAMAFDSRGTVRA